MTFWLILKPSHLVVYFAAVFRQDLVNIAKTTLSSKILQQDKEYFAQMAVSAILRLKGSMNLEAIHVLKKTGGTLTVS